MLAACVLHGHKSTVAVTHKWCIFAQACSLLRPEMADAVTCMWCRFDMLHTVASELHQAAGQASGLQLVQQLLTSSLPVLLDLLQSHGRSLVLPVAQVRLQTCFGP